LKIKQYLMKNGVKVAVIVLAVLLIVVIAAGGRGGNAGFIKDASGSIKAPVQKAATAMLDWIEGLYGYMYEYDRLVEENNALRAEVAELKEQARDYDEVSAENERYRVMLDLRPKYEHFEYESAKIVSWDSSNYSSAFTISKGSDQGVELGDCVVTEYNAIVGQVVELGDSWATVRTIIDVEMDVGALVGDNSYAGVITGEYSLMKQGLTRMTYLAGGAQIFVDDDVISSGAGGTFPPGLLIGTVTTVMSQAGGQNTYGIVEPACDLDGLFQVFVIKDFEIVE